MIPLAFALLAALAAQDPDKKPDLTEIPLDELMGLKIDEVYSASRFVQKLRQAPSNVTVVSAEEMRRLGHRTLADVFRGTRGTYVTNDRNYSYLGIRGFGLPADYNNRVLFLVDGHRVNDNVYDAHTPGREFIVDLDMIERVEIVRGPVSSLYGSNAFFGVVNVMTRKGRNLAGAELSASAGSFGTYEGKAAWGRRFEDGPEVSLSGSLYGRKGETLYYPEFDDPSTGNGVARNADGEKAGKVLGELAWKGFSLQGAWSERAKEIPTAAYGGIFPTDETNTSDQFGYATLKYERTFGESLDVLARLSYNRYWYRGEYLYDDGLGNAVLNHDSALGYWWGAELLITKRVGESVTLTGGAEYRDNFRQDQKNHDELGTYVDVQESSDVGALFVQADARLIDELRVNAGLRLDDYSTFGSTVNPRASLIWSPDAWTTFKAIYGRAFRAPSAYEMDWGGTSTQKANPDLDPETIETYELSAEREIVHGLSLFVGVFHMDCEDLINLEIDPLDGLRVFRNINEVHTRGVETELRLSLEGGINATASYSYQDAEQKDPDRQMRNSPTHLAKLSLSAPLLLNTIYAGLELQYVGERRTLGGDKTDAYWVANVSLTAANIAKGLDLSVSIYNLFDEEYFDPGAAEHTQDQIEQEGLAFGVKLTWKF